MSVLTADRKVKSKHSGDGTLTVNACSNVRMVRSGLEFFELLKDMIRQAKTVIHFQVYILAEDETGHDIVNALIAAAKRGVSVFILVDGYASQGLSEKFLSSMKNSGISFRYFDPILKSKYFYFGRRLHHKVITIDNHALVGGINISNNYNDTFANSAWLDWALYVEGPTVNALSAICSARVKKYTANRVVIPEYKSVTGTCQVTVNVNDWVRGKSEITKSYLEMLTTAKDRVTIMSSYFIPGKILRKQLKATANRGVRVSVIVGSKSDVWLAKYAERNMYRWMLENKIEVFEYLPNILHAKIATCDTAWLTVGSYNINNVSAYASIELNVEVHDKAFVKNAQERLDQIRTAQCRQISIDELRKTNFFLRFLHRSAYDIFRLILFLFTFYFKEHK